MNTTLEPSTETIKAYRLQAKLAQVDISTVEVVTKDRSFGRKNQAAVASATFKFLGLKGISVTAPNYSMAQVVDVRIPKRRDHTAQETYHLAEHCEACKANQAAEVRIDAILTAAFPNHDDRSDFQTDYHDSCWSIR